MFVDTHTNHGRRHFVGLSILGLAVAPLGCLVASGAAQARGSGTRGIGPISGPSGEIPSLPEDDRQAAALGYREDAAAVVMTTKARAEGRACGNCQLFSGSEADAWG